MSAVRPITLDDGAFDPEQLRGWDAARLDHYAKLQEENRSLREENADLRRRLGLPEATP